MKAFATLATVSMLALAGAAYAQTTPPAQPQGQAPQMQAQPQASDRDAQTQDDRNRRGSRWSRADFDALTDARMAAIQAGLKLTPEQQSLWNPVEQALRAMAAYRADRMEERRADRQERRSEARSDGDRMVQNLDERAQRLTQAAQRVTALSEAMRPFWASLTEDQKRLAPVLLRRTGGGMRMLAGMERGGRRGGDRDWGHHGGRYHHGRMMDHHGGDRR